MEIKGKIVAIPQPKAGVSARGPWKKAFLVIQYEDGQFPKQLLLSNLNKAEEFGRLQVGQTGTFKFDGSVRENNGNHYLDLTCWSWQIDQPQEAPAAQAPDIVSSQPQTADPDMPF